MERPERFLNVLSNGYDMINTEIVFLWFAFLSLNGLHEEFCKRRHHKCRIGDDCHSNFRHRLRSNGVNYVRDFLSQTTGVSQFADGGIKVGQVQRSTWCVLRPAPRTPPGVPRYALRHAAGIWRCALHLGLLRNVSIHMLYSSAWEA